MEREVVPMAIRRWRNAALLLLLATPAASAGAQSTQLVPGDFCSSAERGRQAIEQYLHQDRETQRMLHLLRAYFQQAVEKRLILKNGDYQSADQWQIKGDRVHYHSSERNQWEDIPNSMIDWTATNKWNSAKPPTQQQRSTAMQKANQEYAIAVKEDEAAHPLVAPGVRLPDDSSAEGGVYMLDTYQDKPELVEMVQSGGELNRQMGKNLLRAVVNPLPTGSKQTIELPGRHARIEAHVPQPAIYINMLADKDVSGPAPLPNPRRWKIIRIEQTKDGRIISRVKINLLGKASETQQLVPTTIRNIGDKNEWIEVKPTQTLAPGQYALIEMLSPSEINMNVWDFGVNPSGQENPATRNDTKKNPFDNGYSRLGTASDQPPPKKKPKD